MPDETIAETSEGTLAFRVQRNPEPAPDAIREAVLADPGFGRHFTDHMAVIDWTLEQGWHAARFEPYGAFSIEPASAVLHYGQEVFEGLKAYRHPDGGVHLFRPERNAQRMRDSARRLGLPELPVADFVASVRGLVGLDEAWVPAAGEGRTLYLRPFLIANENFLGVRAAHTARYMVIACPAASYFQDATRPVDIWLSEHYSRAGRGGTGAAKCGGNYAASLLPQRQAAERGCEQVLFLDACEGRYLEELGGMNLCLVRRDGTILTPESDSILPGITRDSLLELAQRAGLRVERRRVPIEEWREGAAAGDIVEAFACGTAAVVTPIGRLVAEGFTIEHPPLGEDSIGMRLREELTGIQNGTLPDRLGWLVRAA
ncbi:MAG: branched-chain amino acid aminotransferase [Pseudoclavibacter sp.]|nr:branched-chain amino acid aminotransferase [Pseudoclavibacter sp.]